MVSASVCIVLVICIGNVNPIPRKDRCALLMQFAPLVVLQKTWREKQHIPTQIITLYENDSIDGMIGTNVDVLYGDNGGSNAHSRYGNELSGTYGGWC